MTDFRDAIASQMGDSASLNRHIANIVLATPEMQAIKKALFNALSYESCMRPIDKLIWSKVDMRKAGLPDSVINWVLEDLTAEVEKGKMTT